MAEVGRAFDLSTPLGATSLGKAIESRIRALELGGSPAWGTDGEMTQLAEIESGALDFYYRPHLFPDMEASLRLGHRLQFDLLPRHLPEDSPLRVAAVLESYCHLSGDLLGWRLEGDDIFVWIADVSGHGVRAGIASASLYFLINSIEGGLPPGQFAQRVNEAMVAARNESDRAALFATAFWLRANAAGEVRYASSGHNPMLVGRSNGEVEEFGATGKPLGLLPDQTFGERMFRLGEEDVLCLFTDGLVEATNEADEEFGSDRVAAILRERGGLPMDWTRRLYRGVREHQASRLFEDDLTFLAARRAAD